MNHLLRYWYVQSPRWVYEHFLATVQSFEGRLAVTDTLRNLDKPLFQDYTWQGRLIGVLLRLARIALGFFIYCGIFGVYLFAYLLWLVFPLLCLASLVGSLFGPAPIPLVQP